MRPTGTYYGTANILEACGRLKIDTRGKSWFDLQREIEAQSPLAKNELETLGTFNAEVARGLSHTSQWVERMRELQRRFDAHN